MNNGEKKNFAAIPELLIILWGRWYDGGVMMEIRTERGLAEIRVSVSDRNLTGC